MTNFQMVKEFCEAFNLDINLVPDFLSEDQKKFRWRLIDEEVAEAREAFEEKGLVDQIHELLDVLYVVYGTLVTMGVQDGDELFAELHRANMTKYEIRNGPNYEVKRREDGKPLKTKNYVPPNFLPILEKQTYPPKYFLCSFHNAVFSADKYQDHCDKKHNGGPIAVQPLAEQEAKKMLS